MAGLFRKLWNALKGGLNFDDDYASIPEGDLANAKNMRSMGNGTNVAPSYEPIVGNAYKFTPETVVVQNKKYRLSFDVEGIPGSSGEDITVKTPDGRTIISFTWSFSPNNFVATALNFTAAFAFALPAGYTVNQVTTSTGGEAGYIEIEFLTIPGGVSNNGWDLIITKSDIWPEVYSLLEVIQEGVDESMLGNWHQIGSFDLLGEVFLFWTTQKNLLTNAYDITDAVDDGTGLVKITTSVPHNLTVGTAIRVSGIIGTNNLDIASSGVWIIAAVTATEITLGGSAFPGGAVYTSGGSVFINPYGLGEIGVCVENIHANVINYTRLLRSRELNFRTLYQIDSRGDLNETLRPIYFTDDFNAPRVFYYSGPFISDGALTAFNPEGKYVYETISQQLKLFLTNNNAHLLFASQTQQGGNTRAGNKQYFIQFLTESFAGGEWSDPSNPINNYIASVNGDPLDLKGDDEGKITGKINNFVIVNIPINSGYKYVQLAVVEYIGSSFSATLIKRELLTGATSQQISHTGYENDQQELDPGILIQKFSNVATAKNIEILQNRLILSNLTLRQVSDFSDFSQTFRHSVEKTTILGVGSEVSAAGTPNYRYGEYYDPGLVNSGVGYCMNDTYRFSAKYKLKPQYGGGTTLSFWIDDIRIDCEAANVTTPDRRDAPVTPTDYNLTTPYGVGIEPDPYVWYVDFHGFNLDFLIDGIPVRELVECIIIERCVRVPEILATGYVVPAVGDYVLDFGIQFSYDPTPTVSHIEIGEFPFISGTTLGTLSNPTYNQATVGAGVYGANFSRHLRYGAFYWVDNIYGAPSINWLAGDGLLVYGNPEKQAGFFATNLGAGGYDNHYVVYNGATGVTVKPALNPILEQYSIDVGGIVTFASTLKFSKKLIQSPATLAGESVYQKSLAMMVTTDLPDTGYGFNIAQYYRELSNYANYNPDTCKYGQRINSKYVPTGSYLDILSTTPSVITAGTLKVFGGDVFIQKTFFKFRYPYTSTSIAATDIGFGGGIAFYSINTINSQMRRKKDDAILEIYPRKPLLNWLQEIANNPQGLDPALYYNDGYTIKNLINSDNAFNPNIPYYTDLAATIIWSELKPDGSLIDMYRVFLQLNIRPLSRADGEIVHHVSANGELLTFQQRRLLRNYFNSDSIFTTRSGSEVIVGSGAVLSKDGQTLSTFGCKQKWSFILGKSQGGHDLVFYFDAENRIMMRVGYDGSVPISIIHKMHSWFDNNSAWVTEHDTPADDQGIHGVWNQEFLEAIWTFRGKKRCTLWQADTEYFAGTEVSYPSTTNYNTFEQFDDIFIAKIDVPGNVPPDSSSIYWEQVPITNPDYYNFYTVVWSEFKNKFQCFHTYVPRIFTKIKNFIGSTRPAGNVGMWYKHNEGAICEWYSDGTTKQVDEYYIEPVINVDNDISKDSVAVFIESQLPPLRTEIRNEDQFTHQDQADFTERERAWVAPVFMDEAITTRNPTGSNKGNGFRMYGKYFRFKIIGLNGVYNKIRKFTMLLRYRNRSPRQ